MQYTSNNWYSHNICNFNKSDKMNNDIFLRNFPIKKQEIILDIRPDIKQVNGQKYTPSDDKLHTNNQYDISLNLFPKRSDKDCVFCAIAQCDNLTPNKPFYLKYLKMMDVDSYVRGLAYPISHCNIFKKNPFICNDMFLCNEHKHKIEESTQLVDIINRWNVQKHKGMFKNIKDDTVNYYCLDNNKSCIPSEIIWNNQTKALYVNNTNK